jgi:aquaporin Z
MDVKTYRMYVAELVGTFLIVFLSGAVCAGLPTDPETGQPRVDPWANVLVALVAGCTVAVVLPITFRESPGCLNPAVTLTFWICKRLDTRQMGILIGMQLLASLLAGLVLRFVFPEQAIAFATPHLGKTLLNQTGNSYPVILCGGLVVEAVLTFLLTFAVFGFLIDRRTKRFSGALVGVAQGAIVAVGYTLTGGSANPARWFGPYVWQFSVEQLRTQPPLYLRDHPVYWAGPILGAVAAGYLYTKYILPPDQAKRDIV